MGGCAESGFCKSAAFFREIFFAVYGNCLIHGKRSVFICVDRVAVGGCTEFIFRNRAVCFCKIFLAAKRNGFVCCDYAVCKRAVHRAVRSGYNGICDFFACMVSDIFSAVGCLYNGIFHNFACFIDKYAVRV